jgi:hypothetical protein
LFQPLLESCKELPEICNSPSTRIDHAGEDILVSEQITEIENDERWLLRLAFLMREKKRKLGSQANFLFS